MNRLEVLFLFVIFGITCHCFFADERHKKIADLIEKLQEEDFDKRGYTAIELTRIGNDAVPFLLAALKDKNMNVRVGAAWALRGLCPSKTIPALLLASNDKEKEVRHAAFESLSGFDPSPDGLAPALRREASQASSFYMQAESIKFLESIGAEDSDTIGLLETLMKHPSQEVRREAARALGKIGPEAKTASRQLLASCNDSNANVVDMAARILSQINPRQSKQIVPLLIEKLKSNDSLDRIVAIDLLGNIGPQARAAVPLLIEALNDEENIRLRAVGALKRIGPPAKEAVPALLHLFETDSDPNKRGRYSAGNALIIIDPQNEQIRQATVKFLCDFIADEQQGDSSRWNAVYELANLGDAARSAIPTLQKAVHDKWPRVRIAATQTLSQLGVDVKDAIPMLIQAVIEREQPRSPGVYLGSCGQAAEALRVIGPPAKEAIPAMLKALNPNSPDNQIAIALALVKIDREHQTDTVIGVLEKLVKDDFYTKGAIDASNALVEIGPKSVPVLNEMLKDPRRQRQRAAAEALGQLGPKAEAAIPNLRAIRNDPRASVRRSVIEACGKINPASTRDILLEGLKDSAWSVRQAAARGLALDAKPTKEVIAALDAVTKDNDLDVRDAAFETLKAISGKTEKGRD